MPSKQILVPTILVLVLVAVALLLRGKGRLPPTPDDAVNLLFQAAQSGDAPGYLAVLSGPLRTSFESTQSQIGAAAFAASLRESVAGMKGLAISPIGESSLDRAERDVELVFSDRNERQRFVLLRQGSGWLVTQIDKADRVKSPIPYGAPVFDAGESEADPPAKK